MSKDHHSSKERSPRTPSVNPIANLAAALALFEPVLVNDGNKLNELAWSGRYKPIDPNKPFPDLHQLLNTCYAAMGAMKDFIKEVDFLRNAHSKLTADAMQAYTAMKGEKLNPGSLIEGVETLIGQKHQCFDVMDKIYCQIHIGHVHEIIEQFRNRHTKVEKAPIVNKTDESDGDGNILSFDPNLGIPESGFDSNGVDPAGYKKTPNDPSTPTSGQ